MFLYQNIQQDYSPLLRWYYNCITYLYVGTRDIVWAVIFRQTVLHLWKLMWSCCKCEFYRVYSGALWWWHDSVSNHQPHHCLFNRLFRCRSKKTSDVRVTGLCAGNSPMTGKFPAQRASNAENVSIWWRHHGGLWGWCGCGCGVWGWGWGCTYGWSAAII